MTEEKIAILKNLCLRNKKKDVSLKLLVSMYFYTVALHKISKLKHSKLQ